MSTSYPQQPHSNRLTLRHLRRVHFVEEKLHFSWTFSAWKCIMIRPPELPLSDAKESAIDRGPRPASCHILGKMLASFPEPPKPDHAGTSPASASAAVRLRDRAREHRHCSADQRPRCGRGKYQGQRHWRRFTPLQTLLPRTRSELRQVWPSERPTARARKAIRRRCHRRSRPSPSAESAGGRWPDP